MTVSYWPVTAADPRPPNGWSPSILLKNSILQEPQFPANGQCISQLTLRIVKALVGWPVVVRSAELRGPPRLKIYDASMGLEFLERLRKKRFSTESVAYGPLLDGDERLLRPRFRLSGQR